MRGLIEQRQEVLEATYARDKAVRKEGEKFYKGLVGFLEKHPDLLSKRKDGSFYTYANMFWDHPMALNLMVVLSSKDDHVAGGIGKMGTKDVVVFKALKGPGDLTYAHSRIPKETVVHEIAHFLDKGLRKVVGSSGGADKGDFGSYYNNPSEWNAYWQEGASRLEDVLDGLIEMSKRTSKAQDLKVKMFGRSLAEFSRKVREGSFWNKDFLKHMNTKTERKFDKRLAQLWSVLKDQGKL